MDFTQEVVVTLKKGFSFFANQDPSRFKYQPGITPLTNYTFPLVSGLIYLVVIWSIKQWMKNRAKFELRTLALVHNFNMMGISIICFLGMFCSVLRIVWIHGTEAPEILLCDSKKKEIGGGPLYYWMYLFYLSKFYELIDTLILAFKKNQLRFLHLYHHWITMSLCYVSLQTFIPVQWIATTLNALVHIPMYYYYGISSMGKTVWWKKYITKMQILQFIVDIIGSSYSYTYFHYEIPCSCTLKEYIFGQSILWSFLFLFVNFYVKTYTSGAKTTTKAD